jgi:hypothetical protein
MGFTKSLSLMRNKWEIVVKHPITNIAREAVSMEPTTQHFDFESVVQINNGLLATTTSRTTRT